MLRRVCLLITAGVTLCGCHVSSKVALNGIGGRNAYNETIQKTTNEQMLLNIVRVRYFDIPFFLDVGTITSQFTYKSAINPTVKIPVLSPEGTNSLGGQFSWQNQPTIQYSPLSGKSFAKQLMQPIDLRTIQQLIYTGWDIDRIFSLLIQSLNEYPNAPLAAGRAHDQCYDFETFYEIAELLRYFQKRMELHVGLSTQHNNESPDTLQIAFPQGSEQSKKLARLLERRIQKKDNTYIVSFDMGFDEKGSLGILTRSLLGSLYYTSLGVEVPPCDIAKGIINSVYNTDNEEKPEGSKQLTSALRVRYAYKEPRRAYIKVRYRGVWFYIDDCDLNSKKTFVLLQQIYNLQATESDKSAPLLTIPLGN